MTFENNPSTAAAVRAFESGYTPIPIRNGAKSPHISAWTHKRWTTVDEVRTAFDRWHADGASGVGLVLGEASGNLVDVDMDHPMAIRLRDNFLPHTPMQSGRAGRPRSHRWYRCETNLPGFRAYKMPDKSVSVEIRSDSRHQTVVPPTVHPSGEEYRWEGAEWAEPASVDGRVLALQVALLAMGAVLLENWPGKGGRHEAYLALAGGLLRFGYQGVHPYWERNLPVVISALADVTHDDDGAETRVAQVMDSTLKRLREDGIATGFGKLAEIIGVDHAEMVRRRAGDIESLAGFNGQGIQRVGVDPVTSLDVVDREILTSNLPPEDANPMERGEGQSTWGAVDAEPYLTGQITMPEPSILTRLDGISLMYPGRLNLLFGKSEAAKSWLALFACLQEITKGNRVMFLDFEDGPEGTFRRMMDLGLGPEDLTNQFRYIHPEGPHQSMQRGRFSNGPDSIGKLNAEVFSALVDDFDPTLIIADGMTVLYGLHGLDTNDATSTDIIGTWLKALSRGNRTATIVIDHTGKGGGRAPIGAHHKIAMVQGSAIHAAAIDQPMPGRVGTIQLSVTKDRHGYVRQFCPPGKSDMDPEAGVVTLDSSTAGISKMFITPPDLDPNLITVNGASQTLQRDLVAKAEREDIKRRIVAALRTRPQHWWTTAELASTVNESTRKIQAGWQELETQGDIERQGVNRWLSLRLKTQ